MSRTSHEVPSNRSRMTDRHLATHSGPRPVPARARVVCPPCRTWCLGDTPEAAEQVLARHRLAETGQR